MGFKFKSLHISAFAVIVAILLGLAYMLYGNSKEGLETKASTDNKSTTEKDTTTATTATFKYSLVFLWFRAQKKCRCCHCCAPLPFHILRTFLACKPTGREITCRKPSVFVMFTFRVVSVSYSIRKVCISPLLVPVTEKEFEYEVK